MDSKESQLFTTIVIAVLAIGGIIAYFVYSLIRHNKKLMDIQRQNAEAQITALEKDRARIATDLHDDLAPMLVAVKMRINSLDLETDTDKNHLVKTNETIDDIAKRMRSISFDLMPSTLQHKGLVTAIKEFINYIGRQKDLSIQFTCNQKLPLNEYESIHVYRIVQEIIHNTIKHAQASELVIVLTKDKRELILATKDNGIGFDYEQIIEHGKGLGLRSLLNRAHLLKAECTVDSEINKGTAINIQMPLTND